MIISHKNQFIFIKTQKTAGTSFEIALSSICGPYDIITPISEEDEKIRSELGFRGPQNFNIPLLSALPKSINKFLPSKKFKFYNHISCTELRKLININTYNDYYKFCFERNPFDKAISLFYHRGGYRKWGSIYNFIISGGLDIIKGYDQYTYNKIVDVDEIFKYENLEKGIQTIKSRLNIKKTLSLSQIKAKSNFRKDNRHYREILTREETNFIKTIWAREIELMKY